MLTNSAKSLHEKMVSRCIGCCKEKVTSLLDLGPMPPSNLYIAKRKAEYPTHRLMLGYCKACGLGQLINPMSPEMVRPQFDWITYNEPEGHLDELVEKIISRFKLSHSSIISGVTYKDDTTLERFKKKGFHNIYRLKRRDDLNISSPLANIETIQAALSDEKIAMDVEKRIGKADVLIARHILEHAHSPLALLTICHNLVKDGGLMVFEVPDSRKPFIGNDHCFIWEEHISYFTLDTLRTLFTFAGFKHTEIMVYPYPIEDSLVVIVRNGALESNSAFINSDKEESRLKKFADSFASKKNRTQEFLRTHREQGKTTVLFGAGHLAAKYINFYDLAPFLAGVIDDNPDKIGRFIPGCNLEIVSSHMLEFQNFDLCLLALNPDSSKKIMKKKTAYLEAGGRFYSIFSADKACIDQKFL